MALAGAAAQAAATPGFMFGRHRLPPNSAHLAGLYTRAFDGGAALDGSTRVLLAGADARGPGRHSAPPSCGPIGSST